jgi:hypothetical protein
MRELHTSWRIAPYRTANSPVFAISTAYSATAQGCQAVARAHLVVGRPTGDWNLSRLTSGLPVNRPEPQQFPVSGFQLAQ